jgi:TRAP-type C4-dicarboxylate transport system permease small subunit
MTTATETAPMNGAGGAARLVKWVDAAITVAAIVISVSALVFMFLALMAEVFVRYMTNQGLGWPTELPSLLFPWLVMSGIVLAAQRGQHISVTAILGLLNRGATRVLLLLLQVLIAATFSYLAWVGLDVIEITGTEVYPMTRVSAHWAYLALIVGFVGVAITALTTMVRLLLADNPLSVRAHHLEEDL